MKIEELHRHFLEGHEICTDTRKITSNCLFFALKGENFNGNDFAYQALKLGAAFAVIDEEVRIKDENRMIKVENVLHTLQELATYHRKYLGLPIIALTGSNGKTTTKELMNVVLSKKYKTSATKGNLNNHIGVPLTLLSMDKATQLGIVEMGANHVKEIEALCKIALPDYGYITNFGKAHLEGFGSIQGVIKGKTELYEHLRSRDKVVFTNSDDKIQVLESSNISSYSFGTTNTNCAITLKDASENIVVQFDSLTVNSKLVGAYNFHNIAAAIAIGKYFKVSNENIKDAIENYIPTNNRSQIVHTNGHKIVLDAYNANPSSMMAAIENFEQTKGDNKLLILGDMFELGSDAEKEHQQITDYLSKHHIGTTLLVGENFKKTSSQASHIYFYRNYEEAYESLPSHLDSNNFILIKASRGMALERLVDHL